MTGEGGDGEGNQTDKERRCRGKKLRLDQQRDWDKMLRSGVGH